MREVNLYDAAVNEVRGKESDEERHQLESDPLSWRDALRSVIDEMDSQFDYRAGVFEDEVEFLDEESPEFTTIRDEYHKWKLSARTFKKHIEARLATVSRMSGEESISVVDFVQVVRSLANSGDDDEAYDKAIDDLYDLLDRFDHSNPVQ